jgi:hypothetical protein
MPASDFLFNGPLTFLAHFKPFPSHNPPSKVGHEFVVWLQGIETGSTNRKPILNLLSATVGALHLSQTTFKFAL